MSFDVVLRNPSGSSFDVALTSGTAPAAIALDDLETVSGLEDLALDAAPVALVFDDIATVSELEEATVVAGGSSSFPAAMSGWTRRKAITFESALVPSTQTNIPIVIDRVDVDFATAQADGRDFRFTAADGETLLPYQIQSWGSPTANRLVAWVRVPSLSSSSDTTVYLYWGNDGATDAQDAAVVWSDFGAVYLLQESGTGAEGEYANAAGAAHAGTGGYDGVGDGDPAATPTRTAGGPPFGEWHQAFDGGDRIVIPAAPPEAGSATGSIVAWWRCTDDTTLRYLTGGSEEALSIAVLDAEASDDDVFLTAVPRNESGAAIDLYETLTGANLAWIFSSLRVDFGLASNEATSSHGVIGSPALVNQSASEAGSTLLAASRRTLGAQWITDDFYLRYLVGGVAFFAATTLALSQDYVSTWWNNQRAPGTFAAFGSLETASAGPATIALDALATDSALEELGLEAAPVGLGLDELETVSGLEEITVALAPAGLALDDLATGTGLEELTVAAGAAALGLDDLATTSGLEELTVDALAGAVTLDDLATETGLEELAVASAPVALTLDDLATETGLEELAVAGSGAAEIALDGLATVSGLAELSTGLIRASRVTGVAPLSVYFAGYESVTLDAGLIPFRDCGYDWDFGDPDSGTWALDGWSKNRHIGPIAAHLYEEPGTYVATLVVRYPDGSTLEDSVEVVVTDPDVVFAGTDTVVVSTGSDFTGAPAGALQVTTSNISTTCNTYLQTGKRVLLKRGDVFTGDGYIDVRYAGPGILGAWGLGAKPLLDGVQLNIGHPSAPYVANDWRVMDLEVVYPGNSWMVGADVCYDNTFVRVAADQGDAGSGVSFVSSVPSYFGRDDIWRRLHFYECESLNCTSGNFFIDGIENVFLGCRTEYTTDDANGWAIRCSWAQGCLWAHHRSAFPDEGRGYLKLHAPNWSSSWSFGAGKYSEFNQFFRCEFEMRSGAIVGGGIGSQTSGIADERLRYFVFDSCRWKHPASGPDIFGVYARHVDVRNSIIDVTGTSADSSLDVYYHEILPSSLTDPPPSDVRFRHCTWFRNGAAVSGTYLPAYAKDNAGPGDPIEHRAENNLVAVNASGGVAWTRLTAVNNTVELSPFAATPDFADPTTLRLASGATARSAGGDLAAPIWFDYEGKLRPATSPDAGAIQFSDGGLALDGLATVSGLEELVLDAGPSALALDDLATTSGLEELTTSGGAAPGEAALDDLATTSGLEELTLAAAPVTLALDDLATTAGIEELVFAAAPVAFTLDDLATGTGLEELAVTELAGAIALDDLAGTSGLDEVVVDALAGSISLSDLATTSGLEEATVASLAVVLALNDLETPTGLEEVVLAAAPVTFALDDLETASAFGELDLEPLSGSIALGEALSESGLDELVVTESNFVPLDGLASVSRLEELRVDVVLPSFEGGARGGGRSRYGHAGRRYGGDRWKKRGF